MESMEKIGQDAWMSNKNVMTRGDGMGGCAGACDRHDLIYPYNLRHNFLDFSNYQWSAGKLIHQSTVLFWSMISQPIEMFSKWWIHSRYM